MVENGALALIALFALIGLIAITWSKSKAEIVNSSSSMGKPVFSLTKLKKSVTCVPGGDTVGLSERSGLLKGARIIQGN